MYALRTFLKRNNTTDGSARRPQINLSSVYLNSTPLVKDVDFRFENFQNRTPLHMVLAANFLTNTAPSLPLILKAVKALLKAGANPNLTDDADDTPLSLWIKNGWRFTKSQSQGNTRVLQTLQKTYLQITEKLIQAHDVDLNHIPTGSRTTPLQSLAHEIRGMPIDLFLAIFKLFIKNNVDLSANNTNESVFIGLVSYLTVGVRASEHKKALRYVTDYLNSHQPNLDITPSHLTMYPLNVFLETYGYLLANIEDIDEDSLIEAFDLLLSKTTAFPTQRLSVLDRAFQVSDKLPRFKNHVITALIAKGNECVMLGKLPLEHDAYDTFNKQMTTFNQQLPGQYPDHLVKMPFIVNKYEARIGVEQIEEVEEEEFEPKEVSSALGYLNAKPLPQTTAFYDAVRIMQPVHAAWALRIFRGRPIDEVRINPFNKLPGDLAPRILTWLWGDGQFVAEVGKGVREVLDMQRSPDNTQANESPDTMVAAIRKSAP